MSTTKTIERIQNAMGPKVVQNNEKKMSPLDYKARDSTDRWSAEDTKKFYLALQLMGTDFGLIETLFEGKRTRNQIKVSIRTSWINLPVIAGRRISSTRSRGAIRPRLTACSRSTSSLPTMSRCMARCQGPCSPRLSPQRRPWLNKVTINRALIHLMHAISQPCQRARRSF